MKALLSALTVLLVSSFAQAGPFVSGGTPGALNCADAQKIYNMKIIYLGNRVGLSGVRAMPTGQLPLRYDCEAVHEALPSAVATELAFECQSKTNSDTIQIFQNLETRKFWGLLLSQTQNGVTRPVGLTCIRTNP